MNTYTKMVGGWQPVARVVEREKAVPITALFAHKRVELLRVKKVGWLERLSNPVLRLSRIKESLRRLSRLRDGLRQQGTARNEQPIIGVVGPKKAVGITAFFRHKQVGLCTPLARAPEMRGNGCRAEDPGATFKAMRLRDGLRQRGTAWQRIGCESEHPRSRKSLCPISDTCDIFKKAKELED